MKTTGIHRETGIGSPIGFLAQTRNPPSDFCRVLSSCDITSDSQGSASLPPVTSLQSETSPSSQQKSNYGGRWLAEFVGKEELRWSGLGLMSGPALMFPRLVLNDAKCDLFRVPTE